MSTDATPDANFLNSITTPGAREFVERKGYASVDHLAVAALSSDKHISSTRRMSGSAVEVPGQNATDEDWSSFFSKVGRPERADQYDLKIEGDTDQPFMTAMRAAMHESGLSQRQAAKLVERYMAYAGERNAAQASSADAELHAQVDAMKRQWGSNWDSNVAAGQKAIAALGLTRADFDALPSSSLPGMANILARIGRAIGEGKIVLDTPEQAAGKIAEMESSPTTRKVLQNRRDPRHATTVAERDALYAAAGGAAPTPAKPVVGSAAEALQEIEKLKGDKAFQDALFNPRDPKHKESVARQSALFAKGYPAKG
jgi:hypothetical protein